jgi:alanyl-tRNA synthetase
MKSYDIRNSFLEYFQSKDHKLIPSSPIIPLDDPTLLFVNAGMVQFKKIFLGEERSEFPRVVTCQKCIRAGGKHSDLENVGHTARHHTFFEMLGNFSFGDYFKKEAISFSWELFIDWYKLPKEKLYISVYEKDDEAVSLWLELTDIKEERIVRLGEKDNFWQMGDTGPCGPCSEIIIDQGPHIGCKRPDCFVGCDCDRFLELWNLVFMQYNKDYKGKLTPLPKPSIDTGMGLERISAVLQNKPSNFETDLFEPIIKDISYLTKIEYGNSFDSDISIRVIADHIRAIVFMLSEGLIPSNEGRGYVLRRIIRRASRHAKNLNIFEPFLYKLTDSVIDVLGNIYPEIVKENERIKKLLKLEEERFMKTINIGIELLDNLIEQLKSINIKTIPGEEIFKLYDTYGLPLDFAKDIAMDAGMKIDEEAFQKELELQRQRSKGSYFDYEAKPFKYDFNLTNIKTDFIGYDMFETEAFIKLILKDGKEIDVLKEGEEGEIILDKTPFYGESGGQVGDKGEIYSNNSHADVLDTKKPVVNIVSHHVKITKGSVRKDQRVHARINSLYRKDIMRNHTATHLLHKALRIVLGEHVKQSGSLVESERLRFDFTHFKALTSKELKDVEDIVNEKIMENLSVNTETKTLQEAISSGAVALFDEKYGELVRVVSIDSFSKELCGGTHCNATGEIGLFIITSEGSVASGIRRIEALTGRHALKFIRDKNKELTDIKRYLKSDKPIEKIEKLLSDIKMYEKELEKLKSEISKDISIDKHIYKKDGLNIVKIRKDGLNHDELRLFADNIKSKIKSGIILVASVRDTQAAIVCMVTKDLIDRYNAGEIVKKISELAGGKGGGRSEMAQGGTKQLEKLDEALEQIYYIL